MSADGVTEAADVQAVASLARSYQQLRSELARVIVGMEEVIEQLMTALLCGGHCILEGVPGLAKTLLVSQLGHMLGLSVRRIQFTPDLMPGDITGSDVLEEDRTTGRKSFRFVKGPLFANLILADEINRTPPKTQSALLEAMQERQVTVGGASYTLPCPFFVLATQNPIEQEGTYPLPEAQLDRFMLKIHVDYPSEADEISIVKRVTTQYAFEPQQILTGEQIELLQELVRKVPVGDHVYELAVRLARATRPARGRGEGFVEQMVSWGAGPRASIFLILSAKARAILHGRHHATSEDVLAMALPVLRHRLLLTFHAEAAGKSPDQILRELIDDLTARR